MNKLYSLCLILIFYNIKLSYSGTMPTTLIKTISSASSIQLP